jgi:hypothetical protein
MTNLIEPCELQRMRAGRAWCQMPEGLRQFLYAKYMFRGADIAPGRGAAYVRRPRVAVEGGRHA